MLGPTATLPTAPRNSDQDNDLRVEFNSEYKNMSVVELGVPFGNKINIIANKLLLTPHISQYLVECALQLGLQKPSNLGELLVSVSSLDFSRFKPITRSHEHVHVV